MFRINLKSSIATVAVIAGVLPVAGPASASSTPLQTSMVSGVVKAPGGLGNFGDTPGLAGGDMVTSKMHLEDVSLGVTADAGAGGDKIFVAGTDTTHTGTQFREPAGTTGLDNNAATDHTSLSVSSYPAEPAHAITMLDYDGSPLKPDSNEVAVEGVTAKTSSLTPEGHLYAGVAPTSAGFFKSPSGMDSETEFMDYTDDSLLD
jgi:hypothetical protein